VAAAVDGHPWHSQWVPQRQGSGAFCQAASPGIRFGFMSGTYILENDGITIAQYESTGLTVFCGPLSCLVNIEGKMSYGNRSFMLNTKSFFDQEFTLLENDQEVGTLHSGRNFLLQNLIADLPGDIPREIQVFLLWTILRAWKVAGDVSG
jgi:hypothetical protein